MIILDANVLIAHLAEDDTHSAAALAILDTEDDLAIHAVTLAESLVGPSRVGLEHESLDAIARLGVEQLPLADGEPLAIARLRARTGLKLPDCCVLWAALDHGAALATFDLRLADAARERGLLVLGV